MISYLNFFILLISLFSASVYSQSFTDVSNKLPSATKLIDNASGVSAIDYNNDGLVDIYVSASKTRGLLLKNNGETYEDVIEVLGIDERDDNDNGSWGGIWADFNNDELLDVYFAVTDRFYSQNTDGRFVLSNISTGLVLPEEEFFSQGVSWLDYNLDGTLDIFIGTDVFGKNKLFKNINNTRFEEVPLPGITNTGYGTYGLTSSDFNNDGNPDIFIAACAPSKVFSVNTLWVNNGDETFTDISQTAGVGDSLASWGVVSFDYDNDGDFDIFVTNMSIDPDNQKGYNEFYRNNGNNTFDEVAEEAGVRGEFTKASFAVSVADFNNDGWLDIYESVFSAQDKILINNQDGTFTDIAESIGFIEDTTNSVAVSDYNNDGWIDIFLSKPAKIGSRLFYNDGGSANWLKISLKGTISNVYGVGSRIEVYSGSLVQTREVNAGDGFIQQNHAFITHFGLAQSTKIDSILVKWPASKTIDKIENVDVNQHITVTEGEGVVTSIEMETESLPTKFELKQNYPNPFNPGTNIKFRIPKTTEMRLVVYDIQGKKVTVLFEGNIKDGEYEVNFDGNNLASGVYIYQLITGDFVSAKKMILLN